MDSQWLIDADELAEHIAETVGTEFERAVLTDRICEYIFRAPRSDSATIKVHVSPFEIVLFAGRGTRFELSANQDGRAEAVALSRAIAAGRLRERVWPNRVKFELVLEDGQILTGGARFGLMPAIASKSKELTYAPYGARRPDQPDGPP